MRLICLQHVWYDDAGFLEEWVKVWGCSLHYFDAKKPVNYPELEDEDVLVVLGGPMSVLDLPDTEWMQKEVAYIEKALQHGHKVIGICLGSQLLAHIYGTEVHTLPKYEMGWAEINWDHGFLEDFDVEDMDIPMFHWHSDLYELPEGTKPLGKTDLTPVQGFYTDQVLAFQFHPEMTVKGIQQLIDHDHQEIELRDTSVEIEEPRADPGYVEQSHNRFQPILEKFLGVSGEKKID
ncbi:type 1 glutamine amidotransferase [Jeotgalibacillus aurantiacus]|uniref:type 1 glutamine amidotransferase n=1 Tax=Jeotgalibacillus aurantiacus TaxID=2763266 RepID=UPI001D0A8B55|nr:type 1 glutamine amidotransferase [Jeotgalibacillus aurantiacus]